MKTLAFLAALVTASAPAAPASAVDPELTVFRVEAAAAVRLVKEMMGGPALEDVYMPMTLLWQAADPTDLKPRGRVTLEKGPFSGEDFARLARAATDELGRR